MFIFSNRAMFLADKNSPDHFKAEYHTKHTQIRSNWSSVGGKDFSN